MKVRLIKHINFPFILLLMFPFYFAYNLYTGKLYFSHNDYPGMYYPFRQWVVSGLKNLEFPLWNPYWGAGHEANIWSTIPIDPYTILEIIFSPRYAYFHLIQCMAIVLAGYYVFRKFGFSPWIAISSSLLFFMSPLVTCWYFEFINTNTFIAHSLTFLFIIRWFETEKFRYVFLMGWSFLLGMFGTKLEFWFFEFVYFIMLSIIAFFIIKPKKLSIVFITCIGIAAAVSAHLWQINILTGALNNSKRLAIPHGLHNIFSPDLYKNLYLSFSDSYLLPLALICILFFAGLHNNKPYYRWFFFAMGIASSFLFGAHVFPIFLKLFHSPVFYGAVFAAMTTAGITSKKNILSTWILFMLPAYYWCKPLENFDELYLLGAAPGIFKCMWGFLVWLGCLQVHRYKTVKIAYLSILGVFLLENQGQIILSYLFGFLWMTGRDNYLIDFSFTVMAGFGSTACFRFKPLLLKIAPFIIVFSAYQNLYYTAPFEPVPGYANPLLNIGLQYDPFTGVPGLRKIIKSWGFQPYRRVVDPDIENRLPQNQGTFLLEHTGNATFYGSITPARYRELINFYRYGMIPQDNIACYPSVYSERTISRLPRLFTKGFTNGLIYYSTVWITPPYELDLLRLLGVTHIITRSELIPSLIQKLKLRNVIRSDEFNIAELSDTLPRSFLIVNVSQENLKDFQENMRPHIELKTIKTSAAQDIYLAESAVFLEYKPEYAAIQAESLSGGYLVLTDVFHPYWSAAVDGVRAEIIPAFHAFRAVKVSAGMHKVEFFYKVPYLKLTFIISLAVIAIFVFLTFYFWNS